MDRKVWAVYECGGPFDEMCHSSLVIHSSWEKAKADAEARAPGVTPSLDQEDDGNVLGATYLKGGLSQESVYVAAVTMQED